MPDRYRQPVWATSRKRVSGLLVVIAIAIDLTINEFQFPESWLFLLVCILGLLMIGMWLILFNDVIVHESGLKIQMFQFFWVSIAWNDVMDIADLPKMPPIYYTVGKFDWQRGGGGTWKLLQIRRLMWIHHLACWIGVGDVWAGILLPPQMFARDALEVKVRKGIEKAGMK